MIPQNVTNYLDARFWLFLHIGLPALGVAIFAGAIALWQEYREDCHVNDEDQELSRTAGKTLGL